MQKRYLSLALLLVILLTMLAVLGRRADTAATMGLADSEKKVYLTFDDGPSTVVTGRMLDILAREEIKATFFVVSDRVKGREETLKRIAREGHTVGVHSASHEYGRIYASDEALLKDAQTCAEVIKKVTGTAPRVYRFPGGGFGAAQARRKKLLEEKGFKVVSWNAVCGDEEIPKADADVLLKETIKTSEGKRTVVLLMHDSATHAATAEALPSIIGYFRAEGYAFYSF